MWAKEQWHTIIEEIESEIQKMRRTLPKGDARDLRLSNLSGAALNSMRAFFNAKNLGPLHEPFELVLGFLA